MTNSNYSDSQLEQAYHKAFKAYMGRENVSGIDVGYKYVNGQRTDDIVVRIHVREKIPESALEAVAVFPKEINGVPVDVIQAIYRPTAAIESLFKRRLRRDTIQPGLSISHPKISAGTFGAVVYDNSSGRPCILSNWHVLAGSYEAAPGDDIIQPGSFDGGRSPRDRIGQLQRSILNEDGDAAIASVDRTSGRSVELAQLETGVVLRSARMAQIGDILEKSGRTTGVTRGKIDGLGAYTLAYSVGSRTIEGFKIVSIIDGNPQNEEISSGGDSGSIWYDPQTKEGVGLHFAGESDPHPREEHAIACHLPRVLDALNISLTSAKEESDRQVEHREQVSPIWPNTSNVIEEAKREEAATMAEPEEDIEFDHRLLQLKSALEEQLCQRVTERVGEGQVESAWEAAGNIQGVGLGYAEDDLNLGMEPGAPSLLVYVAEPVSVEQVKSALVESMGISAASSDDVPVSVIVSGIIEAQNHRAQIRPAPGGVSVGHYQITAGTLGCLALGQRAPRNRRLLMLSNNHVLANSNNAKFGDSIIQPGSHDGGRNPRDRIAILERFVPIKFGPGQVNYVDAATGWCWPSRVRKELLYEVQNRNRLFRISSRIVGCRVNMIVGKSGRTTGLTRGRISSCNFSGYVGYGDGRRAFFRDQIAIRGIGKTFSAGGDSGSVVWSWDSQRYPVGLLFAGGGGITLANKMTRVLSALDINLYT